MFGFTIKKKSPRKENIDAILVLCRIIEEGSMADAALRALACEKLKELINQL